MPKKRKKRSTQNTVQKKVDPVSKDTDNDEKLSLRLDATHIETTDEKPVFDNIDSYIKQGDGYRPWESIYLGQYNGARSLHKIRYNLEHMTTLIRQFEYPSILDAGCFEGYVFDWLKGHYEKDFKYVGFDIEQSFIKTAKKRLLDEGFDITFKQGDIYKHDSDLGKFDIVFCSRVLIHLPDIEKALQSLIKYTNKYLVLTMYLSETDQCIKRNIFDDRSETVTSIYFRKVSLEYLKKLADRLNMKLSYKYFSKNKYANIILEKKQ